MKTKNDSEAAWVVRDKNLVLSSKKFHQIDSLMCKNTGLCVGNKLGATYKK